MIYTVTSTLPLVHGGRTKSLLTRIRFLDKEMGIHNKILTTNYNANYNEVYQKFEENQRKIRKSKTYMIGYLISNYFQYLKVDLRKKRFTLKKIET